MSEQSNLRLGKQAVAVLLLTNARKWPERQLPYDQAVQAWDEVPPAWLYPALSVDGAMASAGVEGATGRGRDGPWRIGLRETLPSRLERHGRPAPEGPQLGENADGFYG